MADANTMDFPTAFDDPNMFGPFCRAAEFFQHAVNFTKADEELQVCREPHASAAMSKWIACYPACVPSFV